MSNDRTVSPKPRHRKADDGSACLARYLKDKELSYSEFGSKVGCTKAHVCGLVNRKSKPSLELAARMDNETNGRVPQWSWATPARARS